ncbi:MAG: NTP transferase domain-containing protein [Pirellulales bacterium]
MPSANDSAVAIVLAAGKGTRMKSDLPKVLVPVCGRAMIRYVLDALRAAGSGRILVVIGYRSDLVLQELAGEPGVEFVEQTEQLGTGHAVMVCREALAGHKGPVLVVAGDSPMLQVSSLQMLFAEFARDRPACLLGTAIRDNPHGLGRIVRDDQGEFLAIVEEKDATPEQRAITEVNMSTYVFDGVSLLWALDQLTTNNAQAEYYITDCPSILRNAGKAVQALAALQPCEALSINTPEELSVVEREMRNVPRSGTTRLTKP